MNLEEYRENPAVRAHFPEIARVTDEFLVQHLIETCLGANPEAQTAEAQVGASKAIANVIKIFRSVSHPKRERKPVTLKKLHRFSGGEQQQQPGEEANNSTL